MFYRVLYKIFRISYTNTFLIAYNFNHMTLIPTVSVSLLLLIDPPPPQKKEQLLDHSILIRNFVCSQKSFYYFLLPTGRRERQSKPTQIAGNLARTLMFYTVYNPCDKHSEHPKIRIPRWDLLHRANAELFVRVSAGSVSIGGPLPMCQAVYAVRSAYSNGHVEQDDTQTFSSNCSYTNFLVDFKINVMWYLIIYM